jgi:nitrogen fixation-related uncharacterized protein
VTYVPLLVIIAVLLLGAATTLTVLFYAYEGGHFDNLKAGAYVIFDDDEPVGEPQDLLFRDEAESSPPPEADAASPSSR